MQVKRFPAMPGRRKEVTYWREAGVCGASHGRDSCAPGGRCGQQSLIGKDWRRGNSKMTLKPWTVGNSGVGCVRMASQLAGVTSPEAT
jgi:hypothetical protein